MQYNISMTPESIARGRMLIRTLQSSEGLVNNYFIACCFNGYNKHVLSPQELYECLPWPSKTVYSKHMDMNPTRMGCITYTVPFIP